MADQIIQFEGSEHHFPEDFTDADISRALATLHSTPGMEKLGGTPPPAPKPPLVGPNPEGALISRNAVPMRKSPTEVGDWGQAMDDAGGPLAVAGKVAASPVTGVLGVPKAVWDFIKGGMRVEPSGGYMMENPAVQAYQNTSLLAPSIISKASELKPNAGVKAALTTGLGKGIRKIPGVSIPLDMLDAYRDASKSTPPPPEPSPLPWKSLPLPRPTPPPEPVGYGGQKTWKSLPLPKPVVRTGNVQSQLDAVSPVDAPPQTKVQTPTQAPAYEPPPETPIHPKHAANRQNLVDQMVGALREGLDSGYISPDHIAEFKDKQFHVLADQLKLSKPSSGTIGAIKKALAEDLGIPQMARGGVVRSKTLALIGEAGPELVIPAGPSKAAEHKKIVATLPGKSKELEDVSSPDHVMGEDVIRGSSNIPLSDHGKRQAKKLGEDFKNKGGLDEIHTSDLARAHETADAISKATGAPIAYSGKDLHSWHLGELEGTPTKHSLNKVNDFLLRRPNMKVPGRGKSSTADGESFNNFKRRALGFFNKLLEEHKKSPDKKIGVPTHYRVTKLLSAWMKRGAPPSMEIHHQAMIGKGDPPASVHRIFVDEQGKRKMRPINMDSSEKLLGGVYVIRHGSTEWNAENEKTKV